MNPKILLGLMGLKTPEQQAQVQRAFLEIGEIPRRFEMLEKEIAAISKRQIEIMDHLGIPLSADGDNIAGQEEMVLLTDDKES